MLKHTWDRHWSGVQKANIFTLQILQQYIISQYFNNIDFSPDCTRALGQTGTLSIMSISWNTWDTSEYSS